MPQQSVEAFDIVGHGQNFAVFIIEPAGLGAWIAVVAVMMGMPVSYISAGYSVIESAMMKVLDFLLSLMAMAALVCPSMLPSICSRVSTS